jgi:hypothetical protein
MVTLDREQAAGADPGVDDRGREAPPRRLQHLRPKII